MQIRRLPIALSVATGCFLISTAIVADPEKPSRIQTQPSEIPAAADNPVTNDTPLTVAEELDALKALAKQLDQRIGRLETMRAFDRAVQSRDEALDAWKQYQTQRETAPDFGEKDAVLRNRYFEARGQYDRVVEQLGEFLKLRPRLTSLPVSSPAAER